ncbi:NAD dependent epimerase/dehydratase family protein [Pseudobythopirellula maris]|uniref:NAD dependent epimerase/dehydratase family protein n=1 Tax=Pseudobythopirellula maris TaxID=2527991 RepID=A0A5C5ZKZ3_9BACT|nr:NAD-dependent epimerase/dehydratase family protein [Pseudobythopirellula maris]TWT87103.1 NAD dependent epimerase/dehydratase family protein [Pseudobythopirellula maris]
MSTLRIGVTGPQGFIARRLIDRLSHTEGFEALPLPREEWDDPAALIEFVQACDAVVHLAGVNRGKEHEIATVNRSLAERLTDACREANARPHVVYASTTQRDNDNPYGRSKRDAEKVLAAWANECDAPLTTLVIPNVYGAGCKPFYNSVVATFCHQLTHGETPQLIEDREVEFLWVEDLVAQLADIATERPDAPALSHATGGQRVRISELLVTLTEYRDAYFGGGVVPMLTSSLRANLYATFLWHVELTDHRHRPQVHADQRGDLCEVIKTAAGGQVFFSTTRPGVTRGDHYHTRKFEWFCVLRGEASIRLRPVGGDAIHEYRVSGSRPEFISIPVLHTHHIENTGSEELLTMFWSNELFDAADPDTYYEKVFLEQETKTTQAAA